jgi:hypothetical protein
MDSATTAEQVLYAPTATVITTIATTTIIASTAATATDTTIFLPYFNYYHYFSPLPEREGVPAAGCCVRGRQAGGRQARQEARQWSLQPQHRLGLQDPQGGYACTLC